MKTINNFLQYINKHYEHFNFTEEQIRKAIDRIAFHVKHINETEQFIVHLYLTWLQEELKFEIDTNIDSR